MSFHGVPQGVLNPPRHSLTPEERTAFAHSDESRLGPAPGTVVLVFVFLLAFMTYFFTNWKVLAFLWKIG